MIERRNALEIMNVKCELLRRSQTRINLLFTMSEIPHAHPVEDATCEVMFRGRYQRNLLLKAATFKAACRSSIPSGGARRDRTDDLMLAKHALSQLSYGPVPEDECCKLDKRHMRSIKVVGLGRLELPTSRLSSARSNQLSYKPLHEEHARAHRLHADASHKRSPWRVFVREERET
jgi:hypothetical protein